jgi:putative ABC transport system permease protein
MSALRRTSWAAITRRRTRSVLTILAIANAVAGLGIFAMPSLLGDAMLARANRDRIFDAWVPTVELRLSARQLVDLRRVPDVREIEARTLFETRMLVGSRRQNALVVGVPSFSRQPIDAVDRLSGRLPASGEALLDPAASRHGRWDGRTGSVATLFDASGRKRPIAIVGAGESVQFSAAGENDDAVVLYVPEQNARTIAGLRGSNALDLHLTNTDRVAARATLQRLHDRLDAIARRNAFSDLPTIRAHGTWPGQQGADNFETFLAIVAFVALISAVLLIANTMSTLVAEQRQDIGILRALGARRRQVRAVYLRTATAYGLLGGVLGTALAVLLGNVLARYFGSQFFGVTPKWRIQTWLVVTSLAVSLGVAIVAAFPSLRRAGGISVGDALADASASAGPARGRIGGLLERAPFSTTTKAGIRSVGRNRRRSAATVFQVALAVGIMLSFLALGRTVVDVTKRNWDLFATDIGVQLDNTAKTLTPQTLHSIAAIPGVARVESLYFSDVELGNEQFSAWGLPATDTMYRNEVHHGRWFSCADDTAAARVVVVGGALARVHHLHIGAHAQLLTAAGPQRLLVIGIDDALNNNGRIAYMPLTTMRSIVGNPNATNGYWIQSRDHTNEAVDRLSSAIEDQLTAGGYAPTMQIFHVKRAENVASNRSIVTTLTVLGLMIVAISLIGLVNAITTSVLDRTREIGVMRSLGARARDVRRTFRAEGQTLTLIGWIVGVPLGYAGARLLCQLVTAVFKFQFAFEFPLQFTLIALVGSLVLARLATMMPLRRATRLRPADALRYQ